VLPPSPAAPQPPPGPPSNPAAPWPQQYPPALPPAWPGQPTGAPYAAVAPYAGAPYAAGVQYAGNPLPPPAYPQYVAPPWYQPPTTVRHTLTKGNWLYLVILTVVLGGVVGGVVGYGAARGAEQTVIEKFFPNQSVLVQPTDIQEVLARVEPAVVSIETSGFVKSGTGDGPVDGAGSGMILTSDGEVLTNNHVVAGATSLTVTLFGQDDPLPARVIGTDPAQDLAMVQIEDQHDLPTVSLGDSNSAQVGDDVIAIGNALALAGGPTVTQGIVSSVDRNLVARSEVDGKTENLAGLLQTDAPINPGNSGGPLVNSDGQVIGMNTAVAESSAGNAPAQDIGFAIAIDTIKPLLALLRSGGVHG
jgi:S1-C subfamily serine protease